MLSTLGVGRCPDNQLTYVFNSGSGWVVSPRSTLASGTWGGGAAGDADQPGDGGGGGGFSEDLQTSINIGTVFNYSVGGGGIPNGGAGTQSTLSCSNPLVSITADGGTNTGGGSASGGNVANTSGTSGTTGDGNSGGNGGGTATGSAALNPYAAGGTGGIGGGKNGTGSSGSAPGGGGGGAGKNPSQSDGYGASGKSVMIFT